MNSTVDRRRFLLLGAGAAAAGCVGCAEGSPNKKRGSGTCGTPSDGGGLGYCLLENREVRVPAAAMLPVGHAVLTGIDDNSAVIVARDERGLFALSAICPHACCAVFACVDAICSGFATIGNGECVPSQTFALPTGASDIAFICNCHGSAFGPDGSRLAGPAQAGLPPIQIRLDGVDALVDLSKSADANDRISVG